MITTMNWQASKESWHHYVPNMNVFIHKVHLTNETHHFNFSCLLYYVG